MRKGLLLVGMVVLGALLACKGAAFEVVPEAQVNSGEKATAEAYAQKVLSAWARDEYPPVTEDAIPEFKAAQGDVEGQKKADKTLEAQLGDFKSMTYHETVQSNPPQYVVYRFKGSFSKTESPAEIRVVYDTGGKLAGFWVKPWLDKMN